MSLLFLSMLPGGVQAQSEISVAGITVTSANASNVLGDGTVSFDAEANTLTLNGATIDLSSDNIPAVQSNIDGLKIQLIGYNEITMNSAFHPAFQYNGTQEVAAMTFTIPSNSNYGVLNVKGLYQYSYMVEKYSISNSFYEGETNGWYREEDDINHTYVKIGYREFYNLWVNGTRVSTANANNVLGNENSSISYDNASETLTLNEASLDVNGNNAIESGLDVLTVYLIGENYITCHNNDDIAFKGTVDGAKVVFDTDASSIGSMQVQVSDNQMFVDITPEYADVLVYERNGWTYTISEKQYGIVVAGTHVKASNVADVLGDDKVSYDTETNTLTLNGATIGGSGSEVTEVSGISYTGTDDLTISLKGTNTISGTDGCNAISYVGEGETTPKLIFTKGDNNACSLQLNGEEGISAITGFSAIEGAWGLGSEDNGLAIIADDEVQYSQTDGLKIKTVVNYIVNYVALSSIQIASYYGLTISGVPVYEGNKTNITGSGISGSGSASFNSETNTLTLNNIMLNPDYIHVVSDKSVSIITSLPQLNINLIGESQAYAIFATDENSALTFKSAAENRGAARLNFWNSASPYFIGFGENKVTYEDGLCLREDELNTSFSNIVALDVPKVVTEEKERGLYYPDHEFVFSLERQIEGFDIYYANMLGGDPVKTTDGKIKLGAGSYALRVYPIYPGMDTDPAKNNQFKSEIYVKVIAKPTFTVANGTYNEAQKVTLENLPEQGTDAESYPQVWYYLNDVKNDSVRYDAEQGIPVAESCKVSVYVLDEDSSKILKSEPVEAQYVIRQNAGLAFVQGENYIEGAEYTIGGENNPALPVLENPNELTVTYSSEDENVATVNATTGEVTIVGMGETTITATSEQTDELLAGEASYILRVNKDLNHSSIQVTLSELTYNGQAQTPTVTVKDGDVTLTLDEHYSIVAPEVGNTNAVAATAENAPVITLISETAAEVNYYVGSREIKFGIAPKQLEEDMVELSATTLPYSGENQKPTVTVTDGELMTTNDYTITNEGGVEVGEYTVTVVAKNNYTGTIAKTFEIINRTMEVGKDVNFATGQTWASYYTTTEDLVLPENLMAYIVTAVSDEAVTVKAINYVPKNVPVLIENNSTATTDNTSAEGNLLVGSASATSVGEIEGNVYVLYNNGFTRATSGSIPAHRAYLVLAEPAGARLSIFEENVTGIDTATESQLTGKDWYTLDGRKLSAKPAKKGLYIMNGKKIVVK